MNYIYVQLCISLHTKYETQGRRMTGIYQTMDFLPRTIRNLIGLFIHYVRVKQIVINEAR